MYRIKDTIHNCLVVLTRNLRPTLAIEIASFPELAVIACARSFCSRRRSYYLYRQIKLRYSILYPFQFVYYRNIQINWTDPIHIAWVMVLFFVGYIESMNFMDSGGNSPNIMTTLGHLVGPFIYSGPYPERSHFHQSTLSS